MRPASVLLLIACAAHAQWGRDINPGTGPQMIRLVADDLARLLAASGDERERLLVKLIETHADERIEAIKRFRDPGLKDLFRRLLEHDNWQVQHRALFALEYYGDKRDLPRAWKLLTHSHRRVREKAAISCIKLWSGGQPPGDLAKILRDERDFHVRRCLEALELRIQGKLFVERVYEEVLEKSDSGLLMTPFISGFNQAKRRPRPVARQGKGSKARHAAPRWCHPLLGFTEEVVEGTSLQPFANLRQNGTVHHVGQDVGACCDGAGYYAVAAGSVRLVHSGSDMGTLIVVEHALGSGETINAVYMHGGDTVFVKAGDEVTCGQLLGTMGMSYSVENGGHFAHLHFGLYPGPFSMTHNYGYKPVKAGLADWRDPAKFLPRWIERTRPIVEELRPMHAKLARAVSAVGKEEFGRAYAEAVRVQEAEQPGSEAYVDANEIANVLKRAPGVAVERANKLKSGGYPNDALKLLKDLAPKCKPIPGAEALGETARQWESDPLFKKALKGERRIASTAARAQKQKDPAKVRAMWQKLLEAYGETCLAPRIREQLGG